MVDWQVTAKTIHCDAVEDEVTIMVYKDWSGKCTGNEKYTTSREAQLSMLKRSLQLRRTLECEGLRCTRIAEYKQQLQDEEAMKRRPRHASVTAPEDAEPVTDE